MSTVPTTACPRPPYSSGVDGLMYSLFWKRKAVLMASSPFVMIDQSTEMRTTRLKIVAPIADTMMTASIADFVPRTATAAAIAATTCSGR